MKRNEIEFLREEGKRKYFLPEADRETKAGGLQMIQKASGSGDAEATYILGSEMLRGKLRPQNGDREETSRRLLVSASRQGSQQARALLNSLCADRYSRSVRYTPENPHPLTGFDGKPIRIDRKGIFVPVDAHLGFDGKETILTLRANIHFAFLDMAAFDTDRFRQAILQGFRDWEGSYEVFGGQPLRLRMELTDEDRLKDSVHVIPVEEDLRADMERFSEQYLPGKKGKQVSGVFSDRRSFVAMNLGRWSVRSTKIIWMQSRNGRFDDPDELRNTAKHEFGHVLGLGDLYASEADALEGVDPARYEELGCFHMFGKWYHAVMCDENAPVSNNDIEMVLLAFSQNRFQRFQPDKTGRDPSDALGKGN